MIVMKTLILSLAICTGLATLAQAAQSPSNPNAQEKTVALAPGLTYSTAPFPWETAAPETSGELNRLLADLRDDIETVAPSLGTLITNAVFGQQAITTEAGAAQYASVNGDIPAKNLSTLLSQNLSSSLGQNLATSLAVPTSMPWSTWGNGPGMVLANVNGQIISVPLLPPRTPWGNGSGVVVTTPAGGVATEPALANASAQATREALNYLSTLEDDLDRVLTYLGSANVTNPVPSATAPSSAPPVYLNPTGR
jgi:hypothetical protein